MSHAPLQNMARHTSDTPSTHLDDLGNRLFRLEHKNVCLYSNIPLKF